jgi:phage-related protein
VSDKPIVWVGSAFSDLRAFPNDARRTAGYQLRRVQQGEMPDDWKPMTTVGHGVYEIRVRTGPEHRVAKHDEAVYVLHAFEKRTRKTRQADIETGRRRLADVLRGRSRR